MSQALLRPTRFERASFAAKLVLESRRSQRASAKSQA
jgi:hypothetical protein